MCSGISLWYKIALPWWLMKNWCFWTMVLEKTLDSPLDCKEFQPVHPKGNQSWEFIGSIDAEDETPILWSCDVKSWLIWCEELTHLTRPWWWKRLKAGGEGDSRMRCLDGITDLMDMSLSKPRSWWWTQGGLAWCSPWVFKELKTTKQLNWTELNYAAFQNSVLIAYQ